MAVAVSSSAHTGSGGYARRQLWRGKVDTDAFERMVTQLKRAHEALARAYGDLGRLEDEAWRERLRAQRMDLRKAAAEELSEQNARVASVERRLAAARDEAADLHADLVALIENMQRVLL